MSRSISGESNVSVIFVTGVYRTNLPSLFEMTKACVEATAGYGTWLILYSSTLFLIPR